MRRATAAAYLGISPSHFDTQRKLGAIPAPKVMLGVELYDRFVLDRLFGDGLVADNDDTPNPWDD